MPILINGPAHVLLLHPQFNGPEHRKEFYFVNLTTTHLSMKKKKIVTPKNPKKRKEGHKNIINSLEAPYVALSPPLLLEYLRLCPVNTSSSSVAPPPFPRDL